MKKSFTAVTILTLTTLAGAALPNTNKSIHFTLAYDEHDFIISHNDQGQTTIDCKNFNYHFSDITGETALPYQSISKTIAQEQQYQSVTVIPQMRLIRENVFMEKIPEYYEVGTGEVITISHAEVQTPTPYSYFQYTGESRSDNNATLHFLSSPFLYDEYEHKLYFIYEMNICIETTQCKIKLLKDNNINITPLNPIDNIILSHNIEAHKIQSNQTSDSHLPYKYDYIIITSASLQNSFIDFMEWKYLKGISIKLVTIESIEKTFEGDDTPLKIKKFIKSAYDSYNVKYILLGGDDTIIPVRYYCEKMTANPKYVLPSDQYYACLDGQFDWDANNDGHFGSVEDNVNINPNVLIGRLPVRTQSDVTNFTNKLIRYESGEHWSNRLLMCGSRIFDRYTNIPSDSHNWGNSMFDAYIRPYWEGESTHFYDTGYTSTKNENVALTYSNLLSELSNGYDFFNMISHGTQQNWYLDTEYMTPDNFCKNIESYDHPFIVTTGACNTSAFDQIYDPLAENLFIHDPCLSEALIRNQNTGVVAHIGYSRLTTYTYSEKLSAILTWLGTFYSTLLSEKNNENHLAEVVNATKDKFIARSQKSNYFRDYHMGINTIGEPEMPLFTQTPQKFEYIRVYKKNNSIFISTETDSCNICITGTLTSGKAFHALYKNVNNPIQTSENISEFTLCITKPNYAPFLSHFNAKNINEPIGRLSSATKTDRITVCTYNSQNTSIECSVQLNPENIDAEIQVRSMFGKHELTTHIHPEEPLVKIPASNLEKGVHIVSLHTNGILLDYAKIIIR